MTVVYLHHSGFAVVLDDVTLIFDPISAIPYDIIDKNRDVLFFVSHGHSDHFHDSIWEYERVGVEYILSSDIWSRKRGNNVHYVRPKDSLTIDKVDIKVFGSTDEGCSFLVKAENKIIFFSGDLNWWAWDPKSRPVIDPLVEERDYKEEIKKLKDFLKGRKIDIAFVPVDPRLDLKDGEVLAAKYFIDQLHPKELIPMHFWGDFDVIKRLENSLGPNNKTKIGKITKQNQIVD